MEVVSARLMDRTMYQYAKGWILYVYDTAEASIEKGEAVINSQLSALCEEFASIFGEIQGLPPKRTHDHKITLLPGAEPINQRPYRHLWEQKNVIEKMISEMSASGIIRNSRSPYASPICVSEES